ncbi:hypothetical protein COW36_04725 [bacterium (Candidatus Blackallbacteria) CG17_big_fil_post_rev_8_21_14_2_50_48_46]|uniref:Uncharacterized protein n=1 Tax=bacterium (Candidatus Blackallbacteria) CG17_big_fil_post_rev_8_21_14_2_50_48_46 TaxID=2014261 RepID=A0A2M7G915_9BACT|nr:MAG: hypothetical protein COW64_04220 [bacterium (Candidatus Blackallbacteria) CG18_big_fil_WC_8_21_14_2_50_49_26]PIW18599.1 MAG: hypothetical protein COW36_04725 [bacterium (Candidatus Blackallbacteria) CG17_big_fil_post_rev_8_21_14_2_50_48_46]PIW46415.1 MAG: hypothetical protein COW20_15955 [bacterium (Candidatus Blackallbacteria) CG13_big_fil_rev_8_21_14_2_50_49_14]
MKLYIPLAFRHGAGVYMRILQAKPFVEPEYYLNSAPKLSFDFNFSEDFYQYYHENPQEKVRSENFFSARAFHVLQDLLPLNYHEIFTLFDPKTDTFMGYHVGAARINYSKEYPTYSEIISELPAEVHFFHKFPDVSFPLVTETFVKRVHEKNLEGVRFILKWDGQRVIGLSYD